MLDILATPYSKHGRPSIALLLNAKRKKKSSYIMHPLCGNYPAVIIKKIIASTIYQVRAHHFIL